MARRTGCDWVATAIVHDLGVAVAVCFGRPPHEVNEEGLA
jgi:hypothetical protein